MFRSSDFRERDQRRSRRWRRDARPEERN